MEIVLRVHHHVTIDEHSMLPLLSVLNTIKKGIEMTNQVVTDLQGQVTRIEALVGTLTTELRELKVSFDAALNAQDMTALREVNRRFGEAMNSIAQAAKDADITPETPVEPAVPAAPPVAPAEPVASQPIVDTETVVGGTPSPQPQPIEPVA